MLCFQLAAMIKGLILGKNEWSTTSLLPIAAEQMRDRAQLPEEDCRECHDAAVRGRGRLGVGNAGPHSSVQCVILHNEYTNYCILLCLCGHA